MSTRRDRYYMQYNAILTRATIPGTNIYSANWGGPPVATLSEWGQLSALELLNSGFGLLAEGNR